MAGESTKQQKGNNNNWPKASKNWLLNYQFKRVSCATAKNVNREWKQTENCLSLVDRLHASLHIRFAAPRAEGTAVLDGYSPSFPWFV